MVKWEDTKFEKVKRLKGEEVVLPKRSTAHSAGYDFFGVEETTIKPNEIKVVRTGIKVKIPNDTFLMVVDRSSNPTKRGIVLANSIGIIDSDYYSNEGNDGEIGFLFRNISDEVVVLGKGDKLGQGILMEYKKIAGDDATGERVGGFGSTGG